MVVDVEYFDLAVIACSQLSCYIMSSQLFPLRCHSSVTQGKHAGDTGNKIPIVLLLVDNLLKLYLFHSKYSLQTNKQHEKLIFF